MVTYDFWEWHICIVYLAVLQLPFLIALEAATTCSLMLSGGPTRDCLSEFFNWWWKLLEIILLRASNSWAAMYGISMSIAETRYTHSSISRLICMWNGICRCFSCFSCSDVLSCCLWGSKPWASSSLARPPDWMSKRALCASLIWAWRNPHRPSCTRVRLYRICVGRSECWIVSWGYKRHGFTTQA